MKYSPNRTFYLMDGRLRCVFAGWPNNHNLREGACQGAFGRVVDLGKKIGAKRVFAPMPGFTNRFYHADDHRDVIYMMRGVDLLRTRELADGGMVQDYQTAMMFAPADCHTVMVLDPKSKWWFMGHLGLECLLHHETVLARAVKNAPAKPRDLLLVAGFGIGPCCNGYHDEHGHIISVGERYSKIITGDRVKNGPRVGQVAFDNLAAIKEHATDLGFPAQNCQYLEACTACYGAKNGSGGAFHSNIYDQGGNLGGRNCFMAIRVG